MDKNKNPLCPICQNRKCDCNANLAPFDLFDKNKRGCGAFSTLELALNCARLISGWGEGPVTLLDRRGRPVALAHPEEWFIEPQRTKPAPAPVRRNNSPSIPLIPARAEMWWDKL